MKKLPFPSFQEENPWALNKDPKRILLVEQDEYARIELLSLIMRTKNRVDPVGSYEEMLALTEKNNYDLLLMNFDLFDNIFYDCQDLPKIPLIALLESPCPTQIATCYAKGLKDFLLKPLDLHVLNSILLAYTLNLS